VLTVMSCVCHVGGPVVITLFHLNTKLHHTILKKNINALIQSNEQFTRSCLLRNRTEPRTESKLGSNRASSRAQLVWQAYLHQGLHKSRSTTMDHINKEVKTGYNCKE
jgi:hypothetical protein